MPEVKLAECLTALTRLLEAHPDAQRSVTHGRTWRERCRRPGVTVRPIDCMEGGMGVWINRVEPDGRQITAFVGKPLLLSLDPVKNTELCFRVDCPQAAMARNLGGIPSSKLCQSSVARVVAHLRPILTTPASEQLDIVTLWDSLETLHVNYKSPEGALMGVA